MLINSTFHNNSISLFHSFYRLSSPFNGYANAKNAYAHLKK